MDSQLSAKTFLDQYYELALMVNSAIKAQDIDIVLNLLDAREELIKSFNLSNMNCPSNEELLVQIKQIESENEIALKAFYQAMTLRSDENKRQLQSLQNGIKVSDKYHSPYTDSSGSYIDKKR